MTGIDDLDAEKSNVEVVAESLTGFEEIAITLSFGKDISELTPTMSARALLFVLERRAGSTDAAAKQTAMDATLKDVMARFEDNQGKEGAKRA